jgi:hypothetical protein
VWTFGIDLLSILCRESNSVDDGGFPVFKNRELSRVVNLWVSKKKREIGLNSSRVLQCVSDLYS